MDYEDIKTAIRTWGRRDGETYDFNGVVHLLLAAVDNLRANALPAELADIGESIDEEQAEFLFHLVEAATAPGEPEEEATLPPSKKRARELAAAACERPFVVVDDAGVQDLEFGWFFPFRLLASAGMGVAGSQGVIVNKRTLEVFHLGSKFPVQRDLRLYDRGYQFESYDLVVTDFSDLDKAVEALLKLRLSVVEPEYQTGTVWRVPRAMTGNELRKQLAQLPAVFADVGLYFVAEDLEAARRSRVLTVELLKSPSK